MSDQVCIKCHSTKPVKYFIGKNNKFVKSCAPCRNVEIVESESDYDSSDESSESSQSSESSESENEIVCKLCNKTFDTYQQAIKHAATKAHIKKMSSN